LAIDYFSTAAPTGEKRKQQGAEYFPQRIASPLHGTVAPLARVATASIGAELQRSV